MTDLDILAVHAWARPDDVAVIDGDVALTLSAINEMVNRSGTTGRPKGTVRRPANPASSAS